MQTLPCLSRQSALLLEVKRCWGMLSLFPGCGKTVGPCMVAFPRVLSGPWWCCWPHCELSLGRAGAKQSDLGRLKQLLLSLYNSQCSFLTMVFVMLLGFLTEFSKNCTHLSLSETTCKSSSDKGRSPEDWKCWTCLLNSQHLRGMLLLVYTNSPSSFSTWEEGGKRWKFDWNHYLLLFLASIFPARNCVWRLISCLQQERLPLCHEYVHQPVPACGAMHYKK